MSASVVVTGFQGEGHYHIISLSFTSDHIIMIISVIVIFVFMMFFIMVFAFIIFVIIISLSHIRHNHSPESGFGNWSHSTSLATRVSKLSEPRRGTVSMGNVEQRAAAAPPACQLYTFVVHLSDQ